MANRLSQEQRADRQQVARMQQTKLAHLLREVLATNPFYKSKLGQGGVDPDHVALQQLPLTTRAELQQDQQKNPPYGTNLTYPLERYTRVHQTSGSSGQPLRWLDTPESWTWWKQCWEVIYQAAGVTSNDRIMFPFAFGPFIGFWGAFEAAVSLGHFVLPCGGMGTVARLQYLLDHGATILCCTPTYALRMIEVGQEQGVDLGSSKVRSLIVAGEPGGSIPSIRARIEQGFAARVFDHPGMTELGPWGFECEEAPGGLHVMESDFLAEVVDPHSLSPVGDGELGELVLTNFGRVGSPLIRYRTGDQVRMTRGLCACGRSFARIEGGVLGRTDDMLLIRGNNVFPSAIEGIVREFDQITEFRIETVQTDALAELVLSIELSPGGQEDATVVAQRLTRTIRDRLHFKPTVMVVEPGTLPRFEMKAKRFVQRGPGS